MKNNKIESKAVTLHTPAPAPSANPPLAESTTPVPQVDAPALTMDDVHSLMHSAAKATMRMERPFILSSWGQAEKRGEVSPRDRGSLLDAKNVRELRTAAAKRGSDGLAVVDAIDRYLAASAMEKALAAFTPALAERAFSQKAEKAA